MAVIKAVHRDCAREAAARCLLAFMSTRVTREVLSLTSSMRTQTNVCGACCKITRTLGEEGLTGIMSGKGGVFRQLMMRVELSARAVVVGNPSLALDQVSVPRIADLVKPRMRAGLAIAALHASL